MNNDCPTCAALWRDYAAATQAHIAVESKLKMAGLKHDHEALANLSAQEQSASTHRAECRRLVEEHELQVHSASAADLS